MRFFPSSVFSAHALFALLAGSAAAYPSHVARQVIVDSVHGLTVEPANGSAIAAGTVFPFSYDHANYCESGYSPIAIYLSTSLPTSTDVATDGSLADGSFVFQFGDFLIANFGLPTMGTPPPSTLTMPILNDTTDGTTLYFSVVETYRDCPGGIKLEFGLETTTVVYGA